MRRLLRLAPLTVVLVVLGLAVGLPRAGAIVGGSADNGAHPNVGILYIDDQPWYLGFCSGTLIAPQEFLTAGHCTSSLLPSRIAHFHVTFDEVVSVDPETLVISSEHPIAVTGWETHPDYKGWPYEPVLGSAGDGPLVNDVGVIHLAQPVDVTPVELPPVGFLDEKAAKSGLHRYEFVNVGYGVNGLDRSLSSPQVSILWDQQREVSSTPFKSLTQTNLLQFGGTCGGDSGGPHFYGGTDSNLEVAVSSTGDKTCGNESSSQRLDTQSVHDWLEQFTR